VNSKESIGEEDVAQVNITGTGAVAQLDRMEQFHQYMRERAAHEAQNRPVTLAAEISGRNMEAIFAAAEKNPEDDGDADLWDAGNGGAIQGRACIPDEGGNGLEVEIRSFRPDLSTRSFESDNDVDNSKGYYITCDCVCLGGPRDLLRKLGLTVGQEFAMQTGADDIIFRLRAFEVREQVTGKVKFPVRAQLTGIKTGSDNKVLKLRQLPVRTATA
jgi:hypothetical protein